MPYSFDPGHNLEEPAKAVRHSSDERASGTVAMCLIGTIPAVYNSSEASYIERLLYTPVEACTSAPVIYKSEYTSMGLVISEEIS